MLPVFFDIRFDSPTSWVVLYVVGLLVIAYGAYAGWRSAVGPVNPKTGLATVASQKERTTRAVSYAVVFALVAKVGLYYALPEKAFLGKRGQGFPLHTYGLLLMTAFLVGAALCGRLAEREWGGEEGKRKREQMQDLALWVLVGAFIGSRILFMLVNWQDTVAAIPTLFDNFPVRLIEWLFGGLVFYGGLLGAMATSFWFARKNNIPFLRLSDVAIPSVALGQCIGRLGCFSAGCCWGRPAGHVHWAVQFPGASVARDIFGRLTHTAALAFSSEANDTGRWVVESTGEILHHPQPGAVLLSQWVAEHGTTLPLHPTQLYESIGQLVLFGVLIVARRYKRFNGEILALWLMAYAVLRTTVELFRGDLERGTLHGFLESFGASSLASRFPLEAWYNFSTSQFISLGLFAAGAVLMVRGLRSVQPLPPLPTGLPAAA
ncbi:MAG: prolipoprotein diacylglyceryl transferase [Myxococcaceae bacterium]